MKPLLIAIFSTLILNTALGLAQIPSSSLPSSSGGNTMTQNPLTYIGDFLKNKNKPEPETGYWYFYDARTSDRFCLTLVEAAQKRIDPKMKLRPCDPKKRF